MPAPKGTRLKPRSNGIWYIVWTGNDRGRSTRTRDRGLAETALAAFIQKRGAPDGVAAGGLTVAAALDYYLHEHVLAVRQDGTHKVAARDRLWYETKGGGAGGIIPVLASHFGAMRVADITDDMIDLYVSRRHAGEIGQPAGDGTIRRELGCLIAAINHNVRVNVRPRRLLPVDVPPIRLPDAPPPRDRWLARGEADALLAATAPPGGSRRLTRAYRFIYIALATGARRRSIETLTWFQVDLERDLIHFNPPGRRQTKKRRVPVPISDSLRIMLLRARNEKTGEFVLDHPGSIRKTFDTAVANAGLAGVTRHTLRHTFATWAAQAGVDIWKIAGILGDDERTVRKNYAHHSPEYLRDAVNFEKERPDETRFKNPI